VSIRAKHDTADIECFSGSIERFVRGNVRKIAFGPTHIDRELWRRDRRLATKQETGDNEKTGAETGQDSVNDRTVDSDGFHG
jgi:hypothetical protein